MLPAPSSPIGPGKAEIVEGSCKEIANMRCFGMDFAVQAFYNTKADSGTSRAHPRAGAPEAATDAAHQIRRKGFN